jgi:hypothetical protein
LDDIRNIEFINTIFFIDFNFIDELIFDIIIFLCDLSKFF